MHSSNNEAQYYRQLQSWEKRRHWPLTDWLRLNLLRGKWAYVFEENTQLYVLRQVPRSPHGKTTTEIGGHQACRGIVMRRATPPPPPVFLF